MLKFLLGVIAAMLFFFIFGWLGVAAAAWIFFKTFWWWVALACMIILPRPIAWAVGKLNLREVFFPKDLYEK